MSIVRHIGKSQLGSAINFKQYLFSNNEKIITVIGEYHNYDFNCINNKDISQYCLERVKNNRNCSILLEYSKYDDPKTIGSTTINSTYNKLLKHKKQKHIVPVDFRTLFLKSKGQSKLYDIKWSLETAEKWTKNKISKAYINPFFTKAKTILKLNPKNYSNESYKNIYLYILNVIAPQFNFINDNLDRFELDPLQEELRQVWNKVMDIGILIHILNKDTTDEYIVIAGNRHCKNLERMLDVDFHSEFKLIHSQSYVADKCIELNGTYKKE
jgi:hypothetical protein